uniref:Uncharacterized protein n=1 Tax=Knipowitschia caucasica TaxID=637954 RepID=A0AAV2J9H1_KNICA
MYEDVVSVDVIVGGRSHTQQSVILKPLRASVTTGTPRAPENTEQAPARAQRATERAEWNQSVSHIHAPCSDDEVEEGEDEDDYSPTDEDPDLKPPGLKPTMRPITGGTLVVPCQWESSPNTPGDESPCDSSSPMKLSSDACHRRTPAQIGLSLNVLLLKLIPELSRELCSLFTNTFSTRSDEAAAKKKAGASGHYDDKTWQWTSRSVQLKGANAEEKRKHIKSLIEKTHGKIPEHFSTP